MNELKPCPFCGNESVGVDEWETYAQVTCGKCDACGPCGNDVEEAVRLWNAVLRKDDMKMEKNCANCVHISKKGDGKVYCIKDLAPLYSCKHYEPDTPLAQLSRHCATCKYSYFKMIKEKLLAYCKHEIGSPEGYVCSSWKAKEPESTPLTPSNSTSLNDLCTAAVDKWGAPLQVQKAVEELAELQLVLIRWMNGKEPASKIRDNIREEREDVEIMLRQLDVIFGRSKEWQHKKYEHLQAIVEDTEDD